MSAPAKRQLYDGSGGSPRVSVVLCVYNGARFLDEALGSLRDQTLEDIEIIVVDDGSTDRSGEIVARHAEQDPRIRVERVAHAGLAVARNRGLELTRSRWVALMDDDDVALPSRLERQVAQLEARPNVVALGTWAWHIGPRGQRMSASDVGPVTAVELEILRAQNRCVFLIAPTVMFDREAVRAVGGFRQAMYPAEDLDLWTRLADDRTVLALRERLLEYRIHPRSVSSSRFAEQMKRIMLIEENARRRRGRSPELEVAEFDAMLAAQPWWQRLRRERIWHSRRLYRVAGARLADRDPRGLVWLLGSAVLAPDVASSRLRRQLLPMWTTSRVGIDLVGAPAASARRADATAEPDERIQPVAEPRVSVVMPTYEVGPYVDEALASLRRQTLREIEIIVVDDGSSDDTLDVVGRHAERDRRIRILRREHGGASAARNAGIEAAKAPWVALLDGDDIAEPERLERQLSFLGSNPDVAALGTAGWRIGSDGHRISALDVGPRSREELAQLRARNKPVFLLTSSVILSRAVALELGGFRGAAGAAEDVELYTLISDHHTVLTLADRLVRYRVRAASMSSTRLYAQLETLMRVAENAARRRNGRLELGVEEFHAMLLAQSRSARVSRWLEWRSRYCYRNAGRLLADRRPTGFAWLAASYELQPLVPLSRLRQQVVPWVVEAVRDRGRR